MQNLGLASIPSEPEINNFLDFIRFGGLVQDVASETLSVEHSSNKKVVMPNVT